VAALLAPQALLLHAVGQLQADYTAFNFGHHERVDVQLDGDDRHLLLDAERTVRVALSLDPHLDDGVEEAVAGQVMVPEPVAPRLGTQPLVRPLQVETDAVGIAPAGPGLLVVFSEGEVRVLRDASQLPALVHVKEHAFTNAIHMHLREAESAFPVVPCHPSSVHLLSHLVLRSPGVPSPGHSNHAAFAAWSE